MLDGNWRNVVDRGLSPIGRGLHKAGVTADLVTIAVSYTHLTLPTIYSV